MHGFDGLMNVFKGSNPVNEESVQKKYPQAVEFLKTAGSNWSPDKTCVPTPKPTFPEIPRRIAYLMTVDRTSARTQQSKKVLEQTGFQVEYVQAVPLNKTFTNKIESNKWTQYEGFKRIAHGEDDWGYLFEDDVVHRDATNPISLAEIVAMEPHSWPYMYLGICAYDPRVTQGAGHHCENRKACGRCSHAQGISREGAQDLLKYVDTIDPVFRSRYMDKHVDCWCRHRHQGEGFLVMGWNLGPNDMKGVFMQDRDNFESLITPGKWGDHNSGAASPVPSIGKKNFRQSQTMKVESELNSLYKINQNGQVEEQFPWGEQDADKILASRQAEKVKFCF